MTKLALPTAREVRAELEALVMGELLGPAGGEHETLKDRPSERYLVGMLAPRRQGPDTDEQVRDPASVGHTLTDPGEDDPDDGETDAGVAVQASLFPSAIGLTFVVDPAAGPLRLDVRYGQYIRAHEAVVENGVDSGELVWQRLPRVHALTLTLPAEGAIGPLALVDPGQEAPSAQVQGVVRRGAAGVFVSLFLVNVQTEPDQNRNLAWLFQPVLEVSAADGSSPFLARAHADARSTFETEEDRDLAMRYRHSPEFAAGHGVAVHATPDSLDPLRARRLTTRVVPVHEVPATEAPAASEVPGLEGITLDMHELGTLPPAELPARLEPLVTAYGLWIARQGDRLAVGGDGLGAHAPEGKRALEACERARERIRAGIRLLATDPDAAAAFQFANLAMARQRVQALWAEKRQSDPDVALASLDVPANRSWRLFQLAFVLLNLEGLTRLDHADRSADAQAVADLLWFPTGGGKTEAYLGLTAYTLAIRRLQGTIEGRSGHAGVAVLMRYTLRLLTIQQFQRAAALVCACELLRQERVETDPRWGTEPFRIGLWVGRKTTPNRTEQAAEAVTAGRSSPGGAREGTPVQFSNCPWCGVTLDAGRDVQVRTGVSEARRTFLYCGDEDGVCPFSARRAPGEGLPVVVVDEEIYRLLPAVVIATVDKFAQMPWNGAIQTLFGQVNGRCPRHGFQSPGLHETCGSHPRAGNFPATKLQPQGPLRPPDLIIQDELHLISGPLGSLTGLYETAVDALASWEVGGRTVRPKVIASTATVRRASEQIRALFLRSVEVFPPQGLDADDSFFAVARPLELRHGRRYMGICAPGRRIKHTLIRVYLAQLAAASRLFEKYGARVADPYMTLVGYFGSLRELAGVRRLVDDDIRTRIRRMHDRQLGQRTFLTVEELTSRLKADTIKSRLALIGRPFEDTRYEKSKAGETPTERRQSALDVLLATNMISVGVDVPRLGLMVVTGQPKTTSEYIQATSRVGRQHPGLVCTVYNWSRPRDMSHYETFESYHATFYRHVEALSVTPFAERALDRGLAALLVSLVRLSGPRYAANEGASGLPDSSPELDRAIDAIARRAGEVEGRQATRKAVRDRLMALGDHWKSVRRQSGGVELAYDLRTRSGKAALLARPEAGARSDFTCPGSLRDVEPSVPLLLMEWDSMAPERDMRKFERRSP